MATQLITYTPGVLNVTVDTMSRAAEVAPYQPPSVTSVVVEWAQNMDACVQLADRIVDTELVPVAYWPLPKGVKAKDVLPRLPLANESDESYAHRRRIAVATTAGVCYRGAELGMSWPQAVASIYMVGGRPGLYAEAMVALVKARGHRIEVVERGRTRCVLRTLRRGDSDWQTFEYSMDDAELAGYVPGAGPNVGNDSWKGNPKYNTDPAAMLYARDASIMCRTVYPDVLGGLVVVELADDEPRDLTESTTVTKVSVADIMAKPAPTPPAVSARTEPTLPAPTPGRTEPGPAGEGESSPAVSPDPAPMTERQVRHINDLFVQLGVTGTGQLARRREVLSHMLSRTIDGTSTMTEAEAQSVIDTLRGNGREVLAEVWPIPDAVIVDEIESQADPEATLAADRQAEAEATYADDADLPDPTVGGDPWTGQE